MEVFRTGRSLRADTTLAEQSISPMKRRAGAFSRASSKDRNIARCMSAAKAAKS
jgi:hypothetical protein